MLFASGGTMGLLTGFAIISGVDILNFTAKIAIRKIDVLKKKLFLM